ncbi:hypothetical protein UVI_02059750 [Ustilaginoidea virens]|uniref:Nuclear pore complex subunit Nup133 n=1 Tax=Ustilaginoidea virens TaxID=1159556 RepID=A0A1B5L3L1_USTVR|nr:hypothetical protein UVI_02059750 [Ustilaginoidea virens]
MFNPSVADGGPATATRSRRRQRPKSTDSSVQQPKAKRQRLPLTEQTFVNPDAQPEMVEVAKADTIATLEPSKDVVSSDHPHHPVRKESNVRAKKSKHGDRAANKGDGSLVLNSHRLVSLPSEIADFPFQGAQKSDIFAASGYALHLTATHAVIWAYNSTSQSPETFTFTLPSASNPTDPLPVACLVSPPASSTEPGLVVVMPGSGKVVFWESISSAATFAFIKKDRSGVEHFISGMSSGEKVIAITNAESAGFILTLNTGRLAYMSVRDGHGRPAISVQFLRTKLSPTSSSGGLLGSIRHAFSHLSLRGDVAAVRADRSSRVGERNIVALTSKGKLQAWRIHRGGHNELIGEADMRDRLVSALQENDPFSEDMPADSFEALDLTYVPKGLEPKYLQLSRLSDAIATDDALLQHLLLLVCLTRRSVSRYALAEVILTPRECQVGMIRPITSYSTPPAASDSSTTVRPRLHLPRPALVAFVVFDRAAVVASVAIPPESPDSQLQADNHILAPSFEDVVDFRQDNVHEVVGSGYEEVASTGHDENRSLRPKNKNPAVVLMVRGAGVVRIVTTDVDKFASEDPPQVSAKSKLEQAVFFGAKKDNPLLFGKRQDIEFSNDQIGEAALRVSQEILSSTTAFLSTLPASLEDNLCARSNALERLILHLDMIGADLDRKTRWNLLFNAEKMHVAGLLWKRHEAFTAARPVDDKKSLIGLIVEFIHQDQKTNPVASSGEVDRVRHWFVNDVFRLEIFVAWAYEVIKVLYKDNLLDDVKVTAMMSEAMEVNIAAQVGAHEFRRRNLSLYGLGDEQLRMGILRDGHYKGMAEPWTGCAYVANNIKRLSDLCDQWYKKHEQIRDGCKEPNLPDPAIIRKIFDELPVLTDCMLTSVLEHARWGMANSDSNRSLAEEYAKTYDADRHDKPIALARAGKWEQASAIAEKHGCLSALAVILLEHIEILETGLGEPGLSAAQVKSLKNLRQAKKTQLEDSFSRYGEPFAFPLYEGLLEKHGVEAVLEFDLDTLGFKTSFLRSRPELARISWIHDVEQERDVDHAANTLVELALKREDQVWKKKIELSLGKLALLAEAEAEAEAGSKDDARSLKVKSDDARREERLRLVDNELIMVRIQDQLHGQVAPSTHAAVDRAAALHFAVEAHSSNIPRRQRALLRLFAEGMEQLLDHQALSPMDLIDMLTLVSLKPEARDEIANPFWMALKVANNGCRPDEVKLAKRLVWRRLYVRDDWAKMNDTQLKDDREVVEQLAETELFAMLTDCIRYQDPRDPFRPMQPHEALGVFTEHLDRRFQGFAESERSKLLDAMNWEDKLLSQHMDKNRLADWVRATFDAAQIEVENTADEATRAGAAADQRASSLFGGGGGVTQALPAHAQS